MKHEEWRGDKKLIEELLEKSNLHDIENCGEEKIIMKVIIVSRYIEYMTVSETQAKLIFDYGIDIGKSKYYRLLDKAISILERQLSLR